MPFFRGQANLAEAILGGWELSGKVRWQSGQYLTPTGNTSIGTRRADYLGGEISIDSRDENQWFNTAAFATAPDGRRGNAPIGMIEGPHWYQWDLSARKKFALFGTHEARAPRRRVQRLQPSQPEQPERHGHRR